VPLAQIVAEDILLIQVHLLAITEVILQEDHPITVLLIEVQEALVETLLAEVIHHVLILPQAEVIALEDLALHQVEALEVLAEVQEVIEDVNFK